MAEVAREWAILLAVQARLQTIATAAGYRTDAGSDVRVEAEDYTGLAAPRVTLFSGGTVPAERAHQRLFTFIVESAMPVAAADAHEKVVALAADVEDALTVERLLLPGCARPPEFAEALYLDRPAGVPAQIVQQQFTVEYRR